MIFGWLTNFLIYPSFACLTRPRLTTSIESIKGELINFDATSTSSTTTPTTMNGGTSFNNPTTSTWINAPLTSDFYYAFSTFLANDFVTATKANKDVKASYNMQDLTGNEWLKSFAQEGLAGYALNSSKQITSSSQITNPNASLLSSLNKQVEFSVTEDISISIPTGDIPSGIDGLPTGSTSTNGVPSGITGSTPTGETTPEGTTGSINGMNSDGSPSSPTSSTTSGEQTGSTSGSSGTTSKSTTSTPTQTSSPSSSTNKTESTTPTTESQK